MEKWSQEVKKSMNMYDWAKEKDDLVEVIYARMDGYVYRIWKPARLPEIPFTLVSPSKGQVHLIPEVIQLCMWAQVMTAMKALPGSLL